MTEDLAQEEIKGKRSTNIIFWAGVLIILMIVIFLLLLFLPTEDVETKKVVKENVGLIKSRLSGSTVVNNAEYKLNGFRRLDVIGTRKSPRTAKFLVVDLKIRNLSARPEILSDTMVRTGLKGQRLSSIHGVFTDMYYADIRRLSPWGRLMKSGQSVDATAVFIVSRAKKNITLQVYGFDWTKNDSKEMIIDLAGQEPAGGQSEEPDESKDI